MLGELSGSGGFETMIPLGSGNALRGADPKMLTQLQVNDQDLYSDLHKKVNFYIDLYIYAINLPPAPPIFDLGYREENLMDEFYEHVDAEVLDELFEPSDSDSGLAFIGVLKIAVTTARKDLKELSSAQNATFLDKGGKKILTLGDRHEAIFASIKACFEFEQNQSASRVGDIRETARADTYLDALVLVHHAHG